MEKEEGEEVEFGGGGGREKEERKGGGEGIMEGRKKKNGKEGAGRKGRIIATSPAVTEASGYRRGLVDFLFSGCFQYQ